jgi:phenylacetate-CoA ligase
MGPGVAIECLEQNGLHLAEDHFYAEIIDPKTGELLPDGEWGELVLTSIDREACPVVRYRTRDITRIMPGACACGRTHRRIDRLHGRTDDMLIIRGVNVFPSQIEDVMETFPEVASWYRIELTRRNGLDVVTLKAEVNPDYAFDEIAAIERLQKRMKGAMKSALSVNIDVKIVEPKSIERSTGKAKRIVDLR